MTIEVAETAWSILKPLDVDGAPIDDPFDVRIEETLVEIHDGEASVTLHREPDGWVDRLAQIVEQERRSIDSLLDHGSG